MLILYFLLTCLETFDVDRNVVLFDHQPERWPRNDSAEKARKPANLPNENDIKTLKTYIDNSITYVTSNFEKNKYATLRNLVAARLTLYNARRGEEASRMLLKEYEDAVKGTWVPKEVDIISDEAEKYLLGKFKIAFMRGKGRKFVPVLIPCDLIPAIDVLLREREKFGINDTNPFLFATKHSRSHSSGWHAVAEVCRMAGLNTNITATKMRHRISCVFSSIDMTSHSQKIFLNHMGHGLEINKENYQCPPAVQTIKVMGHILDDIDAGSSFVRCILLLKVFCLVCCLLLLFYKSLHYLIINVVVLAIYACT